MVVSYLSETINLSLTLLTFTLNPFLKNLKSLLNKINLKDTFFNNPMLN
jgi:hypothetical protein